MPKLASKALIELIEIADIVSRFGPKKYLTRLAKSEKPAGRLYAALLELKSSPDEGTLMELLGLTMNRRAYQKLLSKLRSSLLNLMFRLDLDREDYSKHSQKLYFVNRAMFLVRSMRFHGADNAAFSLASRALIIAAEIEHWQAAVYFTTELREHASIEGDAKGYDRAIRDYWRYATCSKIEEELIEVRERVYLVFARSSAEHPELVGMIREALAQFETQVRELETYKLQDLVLQLKKLALDCEMDYAEALRINDDGAKLLDTFPVFETRSRRAILTKARLLPLIQLRKYDEAEFVLTTCEQLFEVGSANWYYVKRSHFVLLMHTGRFDEAYELCLSIRSGKFFSAQSEAQLDVWQLFQLYADYFTNRTLSVETHRKGEKPGDITQQLLKLTPSFKGDHAGCGMAALVLEIMILLERRRDPSALVERIESLSMYKSRHLKGTHNTQSNSFISLMQLVVSCEFDSTKLLKKSAAPLQEMNEATPGDSLQAMQILPYTILWDRVLFELRGYRQELETSGKQ
jgi:hypothetical protein